MQGLIVGIGSLGAGAIMIGQQKENETELTTAASIWITAAIGVSVGMGFEAIAVLSALITLGILALLPRYSKRVRD